MGEKREARIRRVAEKLANRTKQRRAGKTRSLSRKEIKQPRERLIIAYDLETTRIDVGTPHPKYITAFGDAGFFVSRAVRTMQELCECLVSTFLLPGLAGSRFIAWNGNRFDAYFIGAALLHSPDYIIRPYLTAGNSLRGFRVTLRDDEKTDWEFLDGMSMTGIQAPLKDFLKTFAPEYLKLEAPDWEKEEFDATNAEHRRYAERDSEGLYYAMRNANNIVRENFGIPLQPTIGNCGIKIFQSFIPGNVRIASLGQDAEHVIRKFVMRGGFCYAARKHAGPVWKYDINQAYAAAMREAKLPAGKCYYLKRGSTANVCGVWRINATAPAGNLIPFYHRDLNGASVFAFNVIDEAWITSIELDQLRAEGWNVRVIDGFWFDAHFDMKDYVDRLENLRVNAPGGPKSAQGSMVKAIGNNSYGKTVEVLNGLELVMALNCPPGFSHYQNHDARLQHIWFRIGEPAFREYHQPHIGAFITAHVRMVVRRAALLNPAGWLYADTDCVMFDAPAEGLDIDSSRYGAWKVECEGKPYRVITKKVYADFDAKEKHAKGLNIKKLTSEDFANWYEGNAPTQTQTQRQNFIKAMSGEEMFISRTRRGAK